MKFTPMLYCVLLIALIFLMAVLKTITTETFMDVETSIQKALGLPEPSPTWQSDRIPKLIHQTAPKDTSNWSPKWHTCQASWKEHFPDWNYVFWTDEDISSFIDQRFPTFSHLFQSYDRHIKRVDMFRYFVMYEMGGLYADMDYECFKNFENEFPVGKVSLNQSGADLYQNALMVSAPKHPFWLYVFVELLTHPANESVISATGPNVLLRAFQNAKEKDYVHQLPRQNFQCDQDQPSCFSKHWESGQWKTEHDLSLEVHPNPTN